MRLKIGLTDAFPKLIAFEIVRAAFGSDKAIHVMCREGEIGLLVNQLQAHRLDVVLADERASSTLKAKTFNHRLGRSGLTFCAAESFAAKLRRNFPRSLNGAPHCCPPPTRVCVWHWKRGSTKKGIRAQLVGEFEDSALMEVCSARGRGFTVVPP